MRRLVDIDLLDDEAMQQEMAAGSLVILAVGIVLGVLLAVMLPHEGVDLMWFVLLGAISLLALPVHELIHAAAFVILSGFSARIRFGFKDWMLYTSAAGTILPRGRFCAVLLAPTVVLTAALGLGATALGHPLLGWFLAIVHLAGCTGDMAYVRAIAGEPQANLIEDTERGISLIRDERR